MGKLDRLSIYISMILRHRPQEAHITLDEHGWADVEELLAGVAGTGREIDRDMLEEIVATDKKMRYSFNQDKTLIRANQGHSIPVYHGTAAALLEAIRAEGIKPMSRLYVHLSKDGKTALTVGRRHGEPVVLKVHSGEMYGAGCPFYLSENGVWLTKKVAPEYFEEMELQEQESGSVPHT